MKKLLLALFTLSIVSCSPAHAGSCDYLYPRGKLIAVPGATELCNDEYVAVYDTKNKANIFSAERFDANHALIPRKDAFRPDTRIDPKQRAELKDYLNTGYDRGHMAPAADMSTSKQMSESFLLTNMTPQSKVLNEQKWRLLEEHVRKTSTGLTYVLTGALYHSTKTVGVDKIPVPSAYYKCIWYVTGVNECFLADNQDGASVNQVTLDAVSKLVSYKIN
jgi:endonuclease G